MDLPPLLLRFCVNWLFWVVHNTLAGEKVQEFAEEFRDCSGLPVEHLDEQPSAVAADEILNEGRRADVIAVRNRSGCRVVILRGWMKVREWAVAPGS